MFDKQYRFKGRHALRVDQLTGVFDELSKAKLIDRNVDVYTNAPLIGFLYGRTADLDDLKNPETGQIYNQNVMGDRVIYSGDELQYNFWLIMLLDANYEPDEEKRIDKAFRHYGQDPADEERFDSYVRGGIDVLYAFYWNDGIYEEIEQRALREILEKLMGELSEREQAVLIARYGFEDGVEKTLEEVGQTFGVTRERIRQIESKALRKLSHPTRIRELKDFL